MTWTSLAPSREINARTPCLCCRTKEDEARKGFVVATRGVALMLSFGNDAGKRHPIEDGHRQVCIRQKLMVIVHDYIPGEATDT